MSPLSGVVRMTALALALGIVTGFIVGIVLVSIVKPVMALGILAGFTLANLPRVSDWIVRQVVNAP